MFRIGMKVVCVAINWPKNGYYNNPPKIDGIYTVTYVGVDRISLAEYDDFTWSSYCFRPVQDQYTEEEIEAVNIDELVEIVNEPERILQT